MSKSGNGTGPDGRTVFDILSNGYTRSVIQTSSRGTLGVNLPKDIVDDHGIEKGDDIAIRSTDDDNVVELHFEDDA